MVVVALGCAAVLVLGVIGGGFALFIFRPWEETTVAGTEPETTEPSDTESPSPSAAEPSEPAPTFEVIEPYSTPSNPPDEIEQILATSPLTEGGLPTVVDCDLPALSMDHDDEELEEMLNAGGTCLNQLWSRASSDRDLPWQSPRVEVYEWPDVPADTACTPETFDEDFPRACHLDGIIYWPSGYGEGAEATADDEVSALYMWDLAFQYLATVMWHSSLGNYYTTMSNALESDDPEREAENWRRWSLQNQCLSTAAIMQLPEAAQPPQSLQDRLTDTESWDPGEPPYELAPEAWVHWVEQGLRSGGDLSRCNTWDAPLEDVG